MLSWFRRRPDPRGRPTCHANPGRGTRGRVGFERDGRNWTEEVDVVRTMERVLGRQGQPVKARDNWLEHRPSGLIIRPQLVKAVALENSGVRSVTTVELAHPALVPDGTFEFQHGWGDDLEASVNRGFDMWAKTDLVPLFDALLPTPATCMMMEMEFPAKEGKPALTRRAILGPVAHFRKEPPPPDAAEDPHPFCTCCFLTNTFIAFKDLIEDTGFIAIRFFAARNDDGAPGADCRVNGVNHQSGAEALRQYAATWPGSGYEFRKQYVVIHTRGEAKAASA